MKRKALVMGGGGIIGIAWETGLAAGLSANGLDLRTADLVVGTSAGSVVGTQLAHGFDPAQMLALQQLDMPGTGVSISQLNTGGTAAIFAKWFSATEMSEELCKEIGCMALELETMPEESWLSIFAMLAMDWPERPLKITAVEASTGTFTVWDRESGAPLQLAVASSCTVPGLFPPVTINGRRYVDGGVRSATNADLATGYDSVLIIAPMGVGAEGPRQQRNEEQAETGPMDVHW